MCGIFGIVAVEPRCGSVLPISPQPILNALQLTRHRGPDSQQVTFFTDSPPRTLSLEQALNPSSALPENNIAILGHHRLAVIDVNPRSSQPMASSDQRYWISYNGEIYNYRELRQTLEQAGHHFHTGSDTEVLLALYSRFGPDMLSRLNGMFAFALWDRQEKKLFLARDRYGIKPLYYSWLDSGAFAVGSELKNLLALPGCDKTLDYQALSEHLTFQNTYGDKTLVQSIRILEPGHWALLDCRSGEFRLTRYWEPVFIEETSLQPADWIARLRETFETAVKRQWVGDVPIGSFLSGGMDTGAITAVTTREFEHLHTFTCGFETTGMQGLESYFDERADARQMARYLKTEHHEMGINAHTMPAVLSRVVWHLDDFRAGISYQNYLVNQMARRHVTVTLSGVGGDELFAGYPWRYQPMLSASAEAFPDRYYQQWVRLLSEPEKRNLLTAEAKKILGGFNTQDSFRQLLGTCQASDPLNQALCFDMKTFLHGLLVVEDRLSMAHGLESRVPFLDNDLVDLCLRMPSQLKLKLTEDGEPIAKWILKEALRGLVPEETLTRRKQGFTPPDESWYRKENRAFIESILLSPGALERGLFQPAALREILTDHAEGRRNHRFLIWSLLCLEEWHRLLIDPSRIEPPPQPALNCLAGVTL